MPTVLYITCSTRDIRCSLKLGTVHVVTTIVTLKAFDLPRRHRRVARVRFEAFARSQPPSRLVAQSPTLQARVVFGELPTLAALTLCFRNEPPAVSQNEGT